MNFSRKNNILISAGALFIIASAGFFYAYRPASGLDAFATITREDPLFYSPFFESEAFSKAVVELERSEEKLKKTALHNISLSKENYVESYTELLQDTPLFPTDFLVLLPEISKKTEEFNENPTPQKARQLLSLYEQAQKAYEKNAQAMTEAYARIDTHIPDNRPVYYFFTDSATSVRLAQDNFDLIYKNSLALKEEIDRRRSCLSGNGDCEFRPDRILSLEELNALTATANPRGDHVDFIRNTLPFASSTREVRGPYSITSPCWGSSEPQPMYAVYSTNKSGEKTILPKLAEENYYNIVSPKATDAISKKLQDIGLEFYGQAEGTTYECSDLTFYPDILALDFINSQNDSASPKESTQLWENKFGLLAPALQSLADFTNLLETSQRISTDFVISPQFLFTTRSAYSLTYLSFAESVWRIKERPSYLLSQEEYKKLNAPKQFKTLAELKQQGFSEAEIRNSQINQKELIESLVK